jgi:rSAM/selenodomain-associated transferase 1
MYPHQKRRLVVMTKLPLPGYSKTRIIPALGALGAAELARRFLFHTLEMSFNLDIDSWEIWTTPAPTDLRWKPLWEDLCPLMAPLPVTLWDQGEGDLGIRLMRAVKKANDEGYDVVVIGTDCPHLDASAIDRAFESLQSNDIVLYPSYDGGYVLIGLAHYSPQIFAEIPWSTSRVTEKTLERIGELGWRVSIGPTFRDIDEKEDLQVLYEFGARFLDVNSGAVDPKQEDPAPAVHPKQ